MKKTNNSYARNLVIATNKAAKLTGTDAAELRKNYKDFANAPKSLKHGLIIAYRIMSSYAKAEAKAVA